MRKMKVKIELAIACDLLEDLLQSRYNLTSPVRLTKMEHDELSDLCAFEFDVEAEDSALIGRNWDDYAFSEDLIGEAI